jgi:fido (protein-threonine AMPylation protein)
MTRKDLPQENEIIIAFINKHPKGLSIEELRHLLPFNMPKRTLQYRLAGLVKRGLLGVEGAGRSTIYQVPYPTRNYAKLLCAEAPERYSIIPISPAGKELQYKLSHPMQLRPYVTYQREFLDSYQPNHTSYLSESVRQKLMQLGSVMENPRPAGTFARKIYERLVIDLTWNSSRLEGNTYSLLETEKLLATGEEALGKNRTDTQMILNHKDAIEFIVDATEIEINSYTILNIHTLLSNDLLSDPKACGRLRTVPVKIGKSVYLPIAIPHLIEECFHLIIQKAIDIQNPFEQSFFLLVHLPYLQPFLDVNKRTSRLAANIPFIRENLSPLSFVDVPEEDYIQGLLAIYELNRIELLRDVFIWAYERSASLYSASLQTIRPPDPFRVRYRDLIRLVVREVIKNKMNKQKAIRHIYTFTVQQVPVEDQNRFREIVEGELLSLHEGNFARFKVTLSDFFEWQKGWS